MNAIHVKHGVGSAALCDQLKRVYGEINKFIVIQVSTENGPMEIIRFASGDYFLGLEIVAYANGYMAAKLGD